jgi:hypothetical protein
MTRTPIVLFVLLFACGDSHQNHLIDSSIPDAVTDPPILDAAVIDSTISTDGDIDSSVPVDGSVDAAPDAPIDATVGITCHSVVSIGGTDNTSVIVETLVTCPASMSYQVTTKIFDSRNFIEDSILQGNAICGNITGLRTTEQRPIASVGITYQIIETGQTGTCLQN